MEGQRSAKDELIKRMGEVAEHRAARWLEELEMASRRSAKERLLQRMGEVGEGLAAKWLKELDGRLQWQLYRQRREDFCYGVRFGVREGCKPGEAREKCPNYDYCKEEFEAEWPESPH